MDTLLKGLRMKFHKDSSHFRMDKGRISIPTNMLKERKIIINHFKSINTNNVPTTGRKGRRATIMNKIGYFNFMLHAFLDLKSLQMMSIVLIKQLHCNLLSVIGRRSSEIHLKHCSLASIESRMPLHGRSLPQSFDEKPFFSSQFQVFLLEIQFGIFSIQHFPCYLPDAAPGLLIQAEGQRVKEKRGR